jgi:hypothetical protein
MVPDLLLGLCGRNHMEDRMGNDPQFQFAWQIVGPVMLAVILALVARDLLIAAYHSGILQEILP